MRPNNVYDRYRWKKMDQPMERGAPDTTATDVATGGQKIPVLTTTGGGGGGGGGGTGDGGGTSSPTRHGTESQSSSQSSPSGGGGGGGGGGISSTSPLSRRGNKRKNSSGNAAARKRRKLQQAQLKTGDSAGGATDQGPQTKNTVAVLNELKRNLVYNMESQTGPVHAPLFTMSVVVDGQKFMGHGRSKKLARIEAAAAALRSFIQFKDGATLTPIKPLQNVDFTSDDPMIENSIFPLSDPPALPESDAATPAATTPIKGTKGGSEREYKDRQNGPNHNNNNNNTNNNNNVHSTNNILAVGAAPSSTSSPAAVANPTHNDSSSSSGGGGGFNASGSGSGGSSPPSNANSSNALISSSCSATAIGAQQQQHNGHRQVVEKIQQSLDLFKNSNEKNVAWKKRLEKLKASAVNASRNVPAGQPPKPQPEKGPVMLLHELFTDAHFECVSTDGLQHSKFTVVVTVDSQRFEGTGPSKKMAKNAAAKAALASMCNISFSPLQQAKFGVMNAAAGMGAGAGAGGLGPGGVGMNGDAGGGCYDQQKNVELPQTFADAVGKLVIEKFNEVMKGNDVYSRRKVLAGIVMTQGYDAKSAKVISLATGTKCVSGEHMSVTGSVINDSHAEIIARRGLLDFFYSQLDLHCRRQTSKPSTNPSLCNGNDVESSEQTPESSVFVAPADESTLYRLKDGIHFHLYINTAPCGDARVFSPHENDNMDVDKHPNRKARGQLRTKVESGEGTIPVKSSEGIQTWDGVLQGQRLLTMSCSDKISRWNVLGLQGSLLASVIEPIYLHSIVLGSLLHPAHMYRAICGRIENSIQGLPPPYRLNKPKLALMTSAESRNQTKPPNFSINWLIGCPDVEIVNSFTGKLINNNTNTNKMSRLSKQSFYRRFAAVIERLPHARFQEIKPSYGETKMCVPEYQQAKKELFGAFSKEDLGDWLKKPIEQDQFTLMAPKPEEVSTTATPAATSTSINNGSGPVSGGK
ncbi:double-stranded RNA-specific editase Adar isoform X2 [Armigeres subalbatus]|uniref:double-stranded RNA-specific editase Adar isoform X2 n=1 Tax=Armigeres subalbatus TaxID=124917 RepID=UPI002ED38F8A